VFSLSRRRAFGGLVFTLALASVAPSALAQRPLEPAPAKSTLSELSWPKTSPGSLDIGDFNAPGVSVVAGRKRGGFIPKHAAGVVKPVSAPTLAPLQTGPSPYPDSTVPGVAALPDAELIDDEGPATGISLDEAIARMLAENIELRAFAREIPQAEADVLSAGLRSNPLLFADTQFIPYGANDASKRPIGPTQYDVALILPLDVSHKRKERVRVACAARSVVQAQYQDAVRRQISNVGHAFLDLQVAYQAKRGVVAARDRNDRMLRDRKQAPAGMKGGADPVGSAAGKWLAAMDQADDSLGDAREALALLLNLPPEDSGNLAARGRIRVDPPIVPPPDELIRTAIRFRPDLAAARLGIHRADAEIGLAKANRIDDVILFLDPLSYQDNRPAHLPSGRSWDIGITMPLPILNRNQGNIAKTRVNAQQTRLEYAALERRVVSEVRLAARELKTAREAVDRIEQALRPDAIAAIRRAEADYLSNKIRTDEYLAKLEDEQDSAKQWRDALVRYRRATLDLNAALGVRLLP
jgi:cobalt-zinc-cadmium efflux system outer membrane protein